MADSSTYTFKRTLHNLSKVTFGGYLKLYMTNDKSKTIAILQANIMEMLVHCSMLAKF